MMKAMADIAVSVDRVMLSTAGRRVTPGNLRPSMAAASAGAASRELPKFAVTSLPMKTAPHSVQTAFAARAPRWSVLHRSTMRMNGRGAAVNGSASSPPTVAAGPGKNGGEGGGSGTGVITRTRAKTAKPSMYKVLLLNDDYTPMEFVIHVLERFFQKNHDEATQIMLHVHRKGVGVCGVYPYEIAETKVTQVIDLARKHQHPLQCTLEKD